MKAEKGEAVVIKKYPAIKQIVCMSNPRGLLVKVIYSEMIAGCSAYRMTKIEAPK